MNIKNNQKIVKGIYATIYILIKKIFKLSLRSFVMLLRSSCANISIL